MTDEKEWEWLSNLLTEYIKEHCKNNSKSKPEFYGQKEKFGGLRFSVIIPPDVPELFGAISFAEYLSFHMCEKCCEIKEVEQKQPRGWIKTYCKKHWKEYGRTKYGLGTQML